jgi:hypothetical protein
VEDPFDNCRELWNPGQLDMDQDGYGNHCDADFNGDGVTNSVDGGVFLADLEARADSGTGTDMNGDGAVNSSDAELFLDNLGRGAPGPSGLSCAGIVPCARP